MPSGRNRSPLRFLVRTLPYAVLPGLIVAGALWRFDRLPEIMAQEPERIETAALYERLIEAGWLTAAADGALLLAPRDAPLVEAAIAGAEGKPAASPDTAARARLLEAAYTSRAGTAVRRQIGLWNAAHAFLAVRDDRPPPASSAMRPGPVQAGDRPNAWAAEDGGQRPVAPIDLFVPETYRFLAVPLRPGFSDWRSYPGAGPALTLQTVFDLEEPRSVTIQVIGRLDAGRSVFPDGTRIVERCSGHGCPATGAEAAELVLPTLAAGKTIVTLSVAAVPSRPLRLPDLVLAREQPGDRFPRWKPGPAPGQLYQPTKKAPTVLLSADGHVLWRKDSGEGTAENPLKGKGRITAEAVEAGLLPLIGASADDGAGLAGIVTHRLAPDQPATVTTSIDLTVQRAANAALAGQMSRRFRADDPYAGNRIAAIVVLDPETGDILAVAGYPAPPTDSAAWDYIADRAGGSVRPPSLAVLAWNWRSGLMMPGSTLKPLIATAGLLDPDEGIQAMIAGCAAVGGLLPCAGVRIDAGTYSLAGQSGSTANFTGTTGKGPDTIARGLGKHRGDAACGWSDKEVSTTFGLYEAVRDFSNIWFLRLAERLDVAAAQRYDAAARKREHGTAEELPNLGQSKVADMMRRFGFFAPVDLAAAARAKLGKGRPNDVLHPLPAQSALSDLNDPATKTTPNRRETGAVDALAATAIGQRVQAPVLTMARVVASIVRGGVVTARLITKWNDEALPVGDVDLFPAGRLDPLVAGLHAVAQVGTAADAFSVKRGKAVGPEVQRRQDMDRRLKAARCDVLGKTGTAEISETDENGNWRVIPHVNSAWFIGHAGAGAFNALAGSGGPHWTRPIAVAVFVSHVHGSQRFGGAVAAPVAVELFQRLADPDFVPFTDEENEP